MCEVLKLRLELSVLDLRCGVGQGKLRARQFGGRCMNVVLGPYLDVLLIQWEKAKKG